MDENIINLDASYVLDSVGRGFFGLAGTRLLLTGATGFIGLNLLSSIACFNDLNPDKICPVTAVGRSIDNVPKYLLNRKDIKFVTCDVREFEFKGERFDYIIHAASPVDPIVLSNDFLDAGDIIVEGTRQLLNQAAKNPPKRLLHISSGAVYGRQPQDLLRIGEDFIGAVELGRVSSTYAEAKRFAEILCLNYIKKYNLDIAIARPFTFVGPYQDLNAGFAVTQFIKAGLHKERIIIEGDGTPIRSYCYSADLSVALWKILLEAKSGRQYNIGSETEISIGDLAKLVVKVMGVELEIKIKGQGVFGQKPLRYVPDTSRIRCELNFKPHFKLDESILRTVKWYRDTNK